MRFSRSENQILTVVFIGFTVVFGCASLVLAQPDVSITENRALATMPAFTIESLLKGSYTRSLDAHYSDYFPLRGNMLPIGHALSDLYRLPVSGVYLQEGAFDLGRGEALDNTQALDKGDVFVPDMPDSIPDGQFLISDGRILYRFDKNESAQTVYADALSHLANTLPDVRVISMPVPTAYALYQPEDYFKAASDQKEMLASINRMLNETVVSVDLYSSMIEKKDQYLFFRSDHHWTARGAYIAYELLCSLNSSAPVSLESLDAGEYKNYLGSYYRYLTGAPGLDRVRNNPDTVEYFLPDVSYKAIKYNSTELNDDGVEFELVEKQLPESAANFYLCFTGGDHTLLHITSQAPLKKKLLVVKDSYANALVPFLTMLYEEIFVVDYRKAGSEGLPDFDLTSFALTHGVDDILIMPYLKTPNDTGLTRQMASLLEYDADGLSS